MEWEPEGGLLGTEGRQGVFDRDSIGLLGPLTPQRSALMVSRHFPFEQGNNLGLGLWTTALVWSVQVYREVTHVPVKL